MNQSNLILTDDDDEDSNDCNNVDDDNSNQCPIQIRIDDDILS